VTDGDGEPLDDVVRELHALRLPLTKLVLARTATREASDEPADRLSAAQHITLVSLTEGPLGMTELATATGVALSTATRMAQGLVRAGLVHAVDPPGEDRRRRSVALSDKGRLMLARADALQRRRLTDLLAPLTRDERRAILAGARALAAALRSQDAAPRPGVDRGRSG
jgi:DNA-binding MarR family transcriptional regulator